MTMLGARAKFFHYNTMGCLLKALEGKQVTVEIRSNVTLVGLLETAHSDMSLDMSDVTRIEAGGERTHYSRFYIRSRQIGMVHIPDEVDVVSAIKWQLNKTEYIKEKEKRERDKKFQAKQKMKQKSRAQLEKKGLL